MTKNELYRQAFHLLDQANALLLGAAQRHEQRLHEIVAGIDARFVSANEIGVERATVRAEEWAAIRQYLRGAMPPDEPAENCDKHRRPIPR